MAESRRFFDPQIKLSAIKNGVLPKEESKHALKVLRLKVNDQIRIFDIYENEYIAVIDSVEGSSVSYQVLEPYEKKTETKPPISLCIPVLRNEKIELILQKATELGVSEFSLYYSKRGLIKKASQIDSSKKLERWQQIVIGAVKQSERVLIPRVNSITTFPQMLKTTRNLDTKIICLERIEEFGKPVKIDQLNFNQSHDYGILIGPEGGFDPQEVEKAKENFWEPVTLNKAILRTETAAIAAVAILQNQINE